MLLLIYLGLSVAFSLLWLYLSLAENRFDDVPILVRIGICVLVGIFWPLVFVVMLIGQITGKF